VDLSELEKQLCLCTTTNMKKLVKYCKILKPKIFVQKILGKKYPKTEEEFFALFKEDFQSFTKKISENSTKFDKLQIGKRMKLEIPKTWETELSKHGNKKEVWEDLITNKKLPIFATLRNFRNIIKSGVGPEVHKLIFNQFSDYKTIVNSKILPFQFYSAYKILGGLEADKSLIEEYQNALESSLRISVQENVNKIPGRCLIFTDTSGSMSQKVSAKSDLSMKEVGILLGLMINSAADETEFRAFSSPGKCQEGHIKIDVDKQYILSNFKKAEEASHQLGGGTNVPIDRLNQLVVNKEKFDYIFIISDMMINGKMEDLSKFLSDYREKVHPTMKYVAINLHGYGLKLEDGSNELNKHIFGFSDQILGMITKEQVEVEGEGSEKKSRVNASGTYQRNMRT